MNGWDHSLKNWGYGQAEHVKNNGLATEYLGNSCHRSFTNTLLIKNTE